MSRFALLLINGAILTGCAVFIYDARALVLTGLMLFLPFLDQHWTLPRVSINRQRISIWLTLLMIGAGLCIAYPEYITTAFMMLVFTALPEEWFFRAYLLASTENLMANRVGKIPLHRSLWMANITVSVFFGLIHLPTQGWQGLMVILPSLVFGWLYQTYRDIVLVILVHALSNLFFIIFIRDVLWPKAIF